MTAQLVPVISVIIPVFNGEKFLAETLRAIMAQTYSPMEIIVVNDGSTDSSANIARSFEHVLLFNQENLGHGAARNSGIGLASGEFLAFCDADDLWTPTKLQLQAQMLQNNPHLSFVLGRMEPRLEPGTGLPPGLNREYYASHPPAYIPSALLARKQAFEAVGLFDPKYKIGTDSDWFFRARDAGLEWAVLDEVILYRRIHEHNISHDISRTNKELLQLVRASLRRRKNNLEE